MPVLLRVAVCVGIDENYAEQAELQRITEARAKLRGEIQRLQSRFINVDNEANFVSSEIANLEQYLYGSHKGTL